MSLTLTSLPQRVLQRLNVIEIGGTVETAHTALINQAYAEVYNGLVDESLIEWGESEAIPNGRALAIVAIVANSVRHEFTVPADIMQSVAFEAEGAIAFLRRKGTNRANKNKTIEFLDY